ncbi:MAG: hypothetical protein ABI863_12715 [Ginsengibacter sp.]
MKQIETKVAGKDRQFLFAKGLLNFNGKLLYHDKQEVLSFTHIPFFGYNYTRPGYKFVFIEPGKMDLRIV